MKKIILILSILLSVNMVNSQNTILWSISKPDSNKTSYLFGTFHQMGNSFVDNKPKIIFFPNIFLKSKLSIKSVQENCIYSVQAAGSIRKDKLYFFVYYISGSRYAPTWEARHDLHFTVSRALVGSDGQTNYLELSTARDMLI